MHEFLIFLSVLHCTLTVNQSAYENSSYVGTRAIVCPTNVSLKPIPYRTEMGDSDVAATLSVVNNSNDTILIKSDVVVKRPWYAPIPVFMDVAKDKHDEKLTEELHKLLKTSSTNTSD